MAYQTFAEFNGTGLSGMFQYVQEVEPAFMPMILFAFGVIITIATFMSQRRLRGYGDFYSSLAVGCFTTTIVAFILSLVPNLINFITLGACIAITVISMIILMTRGDGGV